MFSFCLLDSLKPAKQDIFVTEFKNNDAGWQFQTEKSCLGNSYDNVNNFVFDLPQVWIIAFLENENEANNIKIIKIK